MVGCWYAGWPAEVVRLWFVFGRAVLGLGAGYRFGLRCRLLFSLFVRGALVVLIDSLVARWRGGIVVGVFGVGFRRRSFDVAVV